MSSRYQKSQRKSDYQNPQILRQFVQIIDNDIVNPKRTVVKRAITEREKVPRESEPNLTLGDNDADMRKVRQRSQDDLINTMSARLINNELEAYQMGQREANRESRLTALHEATKFWKEQCFQKEFTIIKLRQENSALQKRRRESVKETQAEIKWHQQKIKMLEKTIETNNETRIHGQHMHFERIQQIITQKDEFEREAKRWRALYEESTVTIQNMENTNRQLQKDNDRLKETPIPVVLPFNQVYDSASRPRSHRYPVTERPISLRVSYLDRLASQRKQEMTLLRQTNQWPHTASDENLFWEN